PCYSIIPMNGRDDASYVEIQIVQMVCALIGDFNASADHGVDQAMSEDVCQYAILEEPSVGMDLYICKLFFSELQDRALLLDDVAEVLNLLLHEWKDLELFVLELFPGMGHGLQKIDLFD